MKYADTPAAPARGQNILLDVHRKTSLETFLEQLNDPLIFVLFVAAAISILLGEASDAAIILTVILVNAFVGVVQEGKAQKALDALKQSLDGGEKTIILGENSPLAQILLNP